MDGEELRMEFLEIKKSMGISFRSSFFLSNEYEYEVEVEYVL